MKKIVLMFLISTTAFALPCDQIPQDAIDALGGVCEVIQCKPKKILGDCNTCTTTVCTNGKEQWQSEYSICTMMACSNLKTTEFKKEDWR